MSYYVKAVSGKYLHEYEFSTIDKAKLTAKELLEAGCERAEYGEKHVRVERTILGVICAS